MRFFGGGFELGNFLPGGDILYDQLGEELRVEDVAVDGVGLGEHVHVRRLVEDRHLELGDHELVRSDLTPPSSVMNILKGKVFSFIKTFKDSHSPFQTF